MRKNAAIQKRLLIRPALLLLIDLGTIYGYDLIEKLEEFGLKRSNSGAVYRILRSMEQRGLINSNWAAKDSGGPPRRLYSITEKGKKVLSQRINELRTVREQIDQIINYSKVIPGANISKGKEDI